MSNPASVNSNCYVIAVDNTSKSATFVEMDINKPHLIMYNGSTQPVFVTLGKTSAPTAVFPTSATAPVQGTVIPPGAMATFSKTTTDKYISAIQGTSGTGSLYINVTSGE